MRQTATGSMVTVDAAVGNLEKVGLIRIDRSVGSSSGNGYEIFAPKELAYTSQSSTTTTSLTEEADVLVLPKSSTSGETQPTDSLRIHGHSKTSFETDELSNDKYALRAATDLLRKVANEKTGRELSPTNIPAITKFIKIFIAETDAAADHAKTVTSYVACGIEYLRRRLTTRPIKRHKPLPKNVTIDYGKAWKQGDNAASGESTPPEPRGRTHW